MRSRLRNLKKWLLKLNSVAVGVLAAGLSLVFGAPLALMGGVFGAAFFSWRILKDDLAKLKVENLNLLGLVVAILAMWVLNANFEVSLLRACITFLIGWGIFQLFEGDIGGGDVRLASIGALFLNTVQLLAAVSVASFAGLIIAYFWKVKKVPFGSLLIVSLWLSFWIVRF